MIRGPPLAPVWGSPRLGQPLGISDDGVLGGTFEAVKAAVDILEKICPDLGCQLNPKKCELVFTSRWPDPEPFDKDYKRIYGGGFTLLGSPIGDDDFVAKYIREEVVDKNAQMYDYLTHITDPQVAYSLLRATCGFPRMVHILRTVPPSQVLAACKTFDKDLQRAFHGSVHVAMTPRAWQQAQLSVKRGGLGLRQTESFRSAAYIASVCASATLDGWDPRMAAEWEAAVVDYNKLVALSAEITSQTVLASIKQDELSAHVECEAFKRLLLSADPNDAWEIGRLRSVSGEYAGLWLNVIPSKTLKLALKPQEFLIGLRWWLGLPLLVQSKSCICPTCGKALLDTRGYHQLTCRHAGSLGMRHNGIRDIIYKACQVASWNPAKEQNVFPTGQQRAADILCRIMPENLCLDVAVTNGLQSNYREKTSKFGPVAAALYAQTHKTAKYADRVAEAGCKFVPLVTDVHGNWAAEALNFFRKLSSDIAAKRDEDPGTQHNWLLKSMSIALMRGNVRSLLLRTDSSEWEIGDVPSDTESLGEGEEDFGGEGLRFTLNSQASPSPLRSCSPDIR